jgi:hypothetical protein
VFHNPEKTINGMKGITELSAFGVSYIFCKENELQENINQLNQDGVDRITLHNLRKTRIIPKQELSFRRPIDIAYSYKFIGSSIPMLKD